MPKKQGPKGEPKAVKVAVRVPGRLVSRIDGKARKAGVSRAFVVRTALDREFGDAARHGKSYDELVAEARYLKDVAEREEAAGLRTQSAATCLLAAAKELEAASRLSPSTLRSDEERMKSALMMALQLIKKGTGYRQLPDLPSPPALSGSVQ